MLSMDTIQNRTINEYNTYQNTTQTSVTQFINQPNLLLIIKPGYIDNPKKIQNTRFLYMNMNGIRSYNEEKIQYFIEACNLYRVDYFMSTKMNIKWITLTTDKIKNKLKKVGREL